jgi:hypothetical protein
LQAHSISRSNKNIILVELRDFEFPHRLGPYRRKPNNGRGVAKDYGKAREWYEKAAAKALLRR